MGCLRYCRQCEEQQSHRSDHTDCRALHRSARCWPAEINVSIVAREARGACPPLNSPLGWALLPSGANLRQCAASTELVAFQEGGPPRATDHVVGSASYRRDFFITVAAKSGRV